MKLDDMPLFAMLKGRLGYINERQRVIAENVANADTPGFVARDLKPFSFKAQVEATSGLRPVTPAATNAAHLSGTIPQRSGSGANFKAIATPDSETTLDGNQVVLEEQMIKMTEARMNYEAAVGFYQKSLNLIRTAARAPGR